MNTSHFANFQYMAKEYAREVSYNEEKQKHFLAGVNWAFMAIRSTIANAGHPMATDSDNQRMMDWTVRDLKKAMKELEAKIAKAKPTLNSNPEGDGAINA